MGNGGVVGRDRERVGLTRLALAAGLWHIPRPNNKRTGRFWPASKG